ncbi:Rab3 gtpase-activating protein catalytic subunit, partial [Thalictrum thalictroides]
NLWRELWETSKPLPAVKQIPLFDEDLAVEGILNFLEEITPFELFRQLFLSLLGSGFVIAEGMMSPNSNKLFFECKDYIIAACQGGSWSDNVDDLCQVYETVETILVYPEDCLKVINQSEETSAIDEPKRRFKKLSLNFGGKDRQFLRKPAIFSRKPPKPTNTPSGLDDSDWTVV